MPFSDPTTKRFALTIGLPAILVTLVTFAIVLSSLAQMAATVNNIESTLTGRSATAAMQSTLRHLEATDKDYAQWDDAVRNLYGTVNTDWAIGNIVTTTSDAALFDTFYVVEREGRTVLAYRHGEPVSLTLTEAFGPSLTSMIAALPADGKTYAASAGVVRGAWGLATVAVGPIVPTSADFQNRPKQSRYLIVAKALDAAAVEQLRQDYVIDGLRLANPTAPEPLKIDLADTTGTVISALAWSPGRLGSQARARVSPLVLTMLALIGVTMALLFIVALRGWKAGKTREFQLDAALNNMVQGLCMFDANHRLAIFNHRFPAIFRIPPDKIVLGMSLPQVMALARDVDADPDAALTAAQRSLLNNPLSGAAVTNLLDGRVISITHRPTGDGGFVVTFEDSTERVRAEERVRHLAHHDPLTDLPNRVTFYECMDNALGHLRASGFSAILSLDLDHFKSVNDTLGHPVGDLLLQTAAERMRSCIREDDTVARLGGDEFAVLQVAPANPTDITALASRLIEVVGAPYELDGHQVVVGASVGVAMAPADGNVPDVLMKNADLALYRAKADGGGVYRFFEAQMDARMQARRALELDLRKAVVNGEFEVYYQPIVDVKTARVVSCEALLRWNHPQRGMIAPLEFVHIAEETGLIVPIGEWVLRQACAEAARWPVDVTIAVNLSPAQFKNRNLVPSVVNALAASGLPAGRLELEITELVLLQENEGAFDVLRALHDLGIRIAMDDFGTGYSSLGYLRSFPFDKIKIDQSFIRDLPNKEDSIAIVRAVVGLSSSLGIATTAEGVETKEQLASVTTEGCTEFQGFLFSVPRSAIEIERLLSDPSSRAAHAA